MASKAIISEIVPPTARIVPSKRAAPRCFLLVAIGFTNSHFPLRGSYLKMKKIGRRLVAIPFNRIEWTFPIRSTHCIDAAIVDADRHSQSTRLHRSDFAPLIPGCVVSEEQFSNRKSKDVRRLKEHSSRYGKTKTSISRKIKKSSKIEAGNWLFIVFEYLLSR